MEREGWILLLGNDQAHVSMAPVSYGCLCGIGYQDRRQMVSTGRWSRDDLQRTLTEGLCGRDGGSAGVPMPQRLWD